MAAEKKDEKKKEKRPSALKRDLQHEKRRVSNKQFKARVRTAIRSLESAVESKENTQVKENLSAIFSLMDKGVKTGVFKKNKADRTKSRLAKSSS